MLAWHALERGFDSVADTALEYGRIVSREAELFFGVFFMIIGFLNFQNGKNCDGNTTDYLACTNPSTYYYYSAFEIALITIGIFLVILWYFKRERR